MTKTREQHNYRHQPDLRCCMTCYHSQFSGDDWKCVKMGYLYISPIAICDKYEREDCG